MAQNDILKRYLDAGLAFTALTQARAEALVKDLVTAGELQADQAREAVADLIERSRKSSEKLLETVRNEVRAQVTERGLATQADLDKLEARLASLLGSATRTAKNAASTATRAAEQPAPVAHSAAKQTANKTTKRATKKASTAKASTAKASTAKASTAKASTAKASTTKASTAKPSATKTASSAAKTTAKTTAKKATATKSAAKRAAKKQA
jgi:polyhydroxyalkanoate synthesis regulator phasin